MLNDMDSKYILNTYQRMPVEISHGEGSFVFDVLGNKYLDMFGGIAVNLLGHQNTKIKEALIKQANQYLHISNFFASKPVIDLAQKLIENTSFGQVFFSNSGTEAIEAAIKIARKWGRSIHPEKIEFIAFENSFHGRSSGAMALSGKIENQTMFAPFLPGIKQVKMNDITELKAAVSNHTCAIFLEIIQGEGGIYQIETAYLEALVHLSKSFNILIIVDEIQTGLMRTGKLFAYEHFDISPDIVTLAKGIGGGLPLGATLVSKQLKDVLNYGDHGSTFGGNPLACALGNVVLDEILDKDFSYQMMVEANYLKEELSKLKLKHPKIIKEIRGFGFMLGIEIGKQASWFKSQFLNHGILINVTKEHVIRLLPPLNITHEALKNFIDVFHVICQKSEEKTHAFGLSI